MTERYLRHRLVRRRLVRPFAAVAVWFVVATLHATEALGCAVCFGDPNSDMAKGASNAVIFMVAVVGCVLLTIATISANWFVRSRRLEEQMLLEELAVRDGAEDDALLHGDADGAEPAGDK